MRRLWTFLAESWGAILLGGLFVAFFIGINILTGGEGAGPLADYLVRVLLSPFFMVAPGWPRGITMVIVAAIVVLMSSKSLRYQARFALKHPVITASDFGQWLFAFSRSEGFHFIATIASGIGIWLLLPPVFTSVGCPPTFANFGAGLGALIGAFACMFAVQAYQKAVAKVKVPERKTVWNEGPEYAAEFQVAATLYELTQGPFVTSNPWEERYRDEILRIYRRTVRHDLRRILVHSGRFAREVYGVSFDGEPILVFEGRFTRDEAQRAVLDAVLREHWDNGRIVKEATMHRLGRWTARWEHPNQWTDSLGRYEIVDTGDEAQGFVWVE